MRTHILFIILLSMFALTSGTLCAADSIPYPPSQATHLQIMQKRLDLKKQEKASLISQGKNLEQELNKTKKNLIRLGDNIRSNEENIRATEAKIVDLSEQKIELDQSLEAEKKDIAALISALQKIQRTPPEAILLRPDRPIKTAQTTLLLKRVIPEITAKAQALNLKISRLNTLQENLEIEKTSLQTTAKTLSDQKIALTDTLKQRQQLYRQTQTDLEEREKTISVMAKKANTVQELVNTLRAQRKVQAAIAAKAALTKPRFTPEPPVIGKVRTPMSGKIIVRYNDKDLYGAPSKGVEIEGNGGSLIVAPMGGVVRFAGPFKNYNQIVILEHEGQFHSLIGGLDNISVTVGQTIESGEPIATLHYATNKKKPTLYYELRHKGSVINPSKKIPGLS